MEKTNTAKSAQIQLLVDDFLQRADVADIQALIEGMAVEYFSSEAFCGRDRNARSNDACLIFGLYHLVGDLDGVQELVFE